MAVLRQFDTDFRALAFDAYQSAVAAALYIAGMAHSSNTPISALIARYDGRLPRYTSYPTAPNFKSSVSAEVYGQWLRETALDQPLSLYIHVPFCDRLCLYCGCNTSVVRLESSRLAYARLLEREIEMVADALPGRGRIAQIHWGGGTPTSLSAASLVSVMDVIRTRFDMEAGAEVAIEIDPVNLPADRLPALRDMGVTRASLGVQDFNKDVQQAIGRAQSFDETSACLKGLREIGIASVNLDLMYGLPHQSVESVRATAQAVLELAPERIAVFGYAHVPWMKKHQELIPADSLPDAVARFAQQEAIADVLRGQGGYQSIGLDHFALPGDALTVAAEAGDLHRNFQGYTTDSAPALIGIGASAIGSLHQGYAQNAVRVPEYAAAIGADRFAVKRGVALTDDDRLRRSVIEQIMCGDEVDLEASGLHFLGRADALNDAIEAMEALAADGFVARNGARWRVTELGRPFMRQVAATFDAYLGRADAPQRFARAV